MAYTYGLALNARFAQAVIVHASRGISQQGLTFAIGNTARKGQQRALIY